MPIFNLVIESLDGKASEKIQLTGTKLRDVTTVRRPDINQLKEQWEHTKDQSFYKQIEDEYPIERFHSRDQLYANLLEQKKAFTWEKSSTPRGFTGYTNMAVVSLFRNTNMAAVTSCENALYTWF